MDLLLDVLLKVVHNVAWAALVMIIVVMGGFGATETTPAVGGICLDDVATGDLRCWDPVE